ncbi:KDO2-lipid IV(A) lauroyltransferase [Cricetibacter osteomyelitidis]|uniref:Lipid A biosynthesis acyltransferase n=1 Tax=Cricetibacter osteomyelitidis TaxID=1521931 RepID=A0A4R2T9T4_9PAST|nr:Kdo(2)-lipid IV(A) acyltransferase [Cricetibacter osteomyelitidis]TCP97624.1 KDO2-lipid IV(A) lauroyltransferase [Cricetibacter osteomyelitidis]
MTNEKLPKFQKSFLAPKYWGFWLAVGLWRLIVLLPYPVLLKIGHGLGLLFTKLKVGKRRAKIARRNLELSFPDLPPEKIDAILQENLKAVGMAIIETGMAWFWSDERMRKWYKVEGLDNLLNHRQEGILLVGVHFLTLELGARMVGLQHQGIGVYRPNDNPVFDWLQIRGRMRSNKDMIDRKDLRAMIKALRKGDMIWYAPDHDYGRKNAVFVPFFAVPDACTTTGSYYLLKSVPNCKVVPFSPLRNRDNSGYTLSISEPVDFSDLDNETDIAIRMNQIVEKEILKGVEQYMWMHRRFKNQPDENAPSLYD